LVLLIFILFVLGCVELFARRDSTSV